MFRPLLVLLITLLSATDAIQAQVPDLLIERIAIEPANPGPGEPITVTIHARNEGTATPAPDTLMYLWHNTTSPQPCAFDQFRSLEVSFPPGTVRLFTFTVTYAFEGTYQLWAWVDGCEPLIAETDETNNTASRTITVERGDLIVDAITPSVADPVPGQPLFLDVTVRNTGPSLVNAVWSVGIERDVVEPFNCALDAHAGPFQDFPGFSTQTVRFGPYTYAAGGTYPVWAWVDCSDSAIEQNEQNNKRFGEVNIARPDLVITQVSPRVSTPQVGVPFDVDVTVRNVGSTPTGSFRLAVAPDLPQLPEQTCPLQPAIDFAGLAPEASDTGTFRFTLNEARQYTLRAVVDSCDTVPEAREDNNDARLDLSVSNPQPGQPDLVVDTITTSEVPYAAWGSVTVINVQVRNAGTATSGPFRVGDFEPFDFPGSGSSWVTIGTPGPNGGTGTQGAARSVWNDCEWRSRGVASLAPGAVATVTFWRHHLQRGTYAFAAAVDVCGSETWGRVFESSEENNTRIIEYQASGCQDDRDGDGICDADDLCPDTPDERNVDSDGDGMGDVCDPDDDNDGVQDGNDCDPRNPFVYPGAEDCPDGLDNDCDGSIDEDTVVQYRDADGDGFGDPGELLESCTVVGGYVGNADDCDDADANIYPGANGPCDDGRDNDCDGSIDNERTVWGRDADADGFTDPQDERVNDAGDCSRPDGYAVASVRPDPDDGDFMVPEPVTVDASEIRWSTPRGRVNTITLNLLRNGSQVWDYEAQLDLPSDGFARLAPAAGQAVAGRAELTLTPQVDGLALARYETTLRIAINGQPAFEIPVQLDVRNPILRVVHTGDALDGADFSLAWGDDHEEPEYVGMVDLVYGSVVEYEIPLGEDAYLYRDLSDECAVFNGIYDEQGQRVPPADPNYERAFGPIEMDGDRTVAVDFVPNYVGCTSCALLMTLSCCLGMWCNRKGC